jgi:20S proteasome alpha/beta subunit
VFSISPAGSLSLVQAACSGGGGGVVRGLIGAQSMSQLLEAEYKPGLNVEEAGTLAQRCMRLAKVSHSDTDNIVASSIKYLLLSENQS